MKDLQYVVLLYCLVGWSSSNPAEKSISLTPWHYIVKINFVRITKMNQIHVSKSWLVSEQCTINITYKYIYIYIIRPENIINSIAKPNVECVSRMRLYREVLWNNRICILIFIALFADLGPCDTMIICSGRKRRQWAFIISV